MAPRLGLLVPPLLLAIGAPAAARSGPRALACPDGRFLVPGEALVSGGAAPDAISVAERQVAVMDCDAPAAHTLDGDFVRLVLPPRPGAPVAWRVSSAQ
jgi:hypothetical protein